jgi:hypothetical protein
MDNLKLLADRLAKADGPRLEKLNHLRIGDPLQLVVSDAVYDVVLVGYLMGQSVIVTPPYGRDDIHPGQHATVRIFTDKQSYAFATTVRHLAQEPFPHVHLAYPETLQAMKERQHERMGINITGTAELAGGRVFNCTVRDISLGGALIAVGGEACKLNDSLELTLKVAINGIEYTLSLEGEVRSVRLAESGDKPLVLQGLAFKDLTQQDMLALAAFDLLPDVLADGPG